MNFKPWFLYQEKLSKENCENLNNNAHQHEIYYPSRNPVKGYVDADELIGQIVWVHTNRTNRDDGNNGMIGIYDANSKGKKSGEAGRYTNEIRLSSPITFQTSASGAKRIQVTGTRTIIAGVSGKVIPTHNDISEMQEITYNPKDAAYFHVLGDTEKKEILTASEVYFHASQNGQYTIFAKDIEFIKPEKLLFTQDYSLS